MMVEIPMAVPSLANWRGHHMGLARVKASQRGTVKLVLRTQAGDPPELPVTVTLTRIAPRRLDDGDNLSGSMKACRDQVAVWLGCDDGPDAPVKWRYEQERGAPKYQAVRIEVKSCGPDTPSHLLWRVRRRCEWCGAWLEVE